MLAVIFYLLHEISKPQQRLKFYSNTCHLGSSYSQLYSMHLLLFELFELHSKILSLKHQERRVFHIQSGEDLFCPSLSKTKRKECKRSWTHLRNMFKVQIYISAYLHCYLPGYTGNSSLWALVCPIASQQKWISPKAECEFRLKIRAFSGGISVLFYFFSIYDW